MNYEMTGYLHPLYAESFEEFGIPRELPVCGGRILEREIPGSSDHDGIGCYPLFACQNWAGLHSDFENLKTDLVSLSLVADPFGDYEVPYLKKHFDLVVAFKEHFVIDLRGPLEDSVSRHHRYYGMKSVRNLSVEMCVEPIQFLEEWLDLYGNLAKKHNLTGMRGGSRRSFGKLLRVPGILMFRAVERGFTIALQLWCQQGKVAYNHLTASTERGYQIRASYALYWTAISWFKQKVDWIDLGGVPGTSDHGGDGLRHFKKGWATGTRPVYFCGRIFDPKRYSEITNSKGIFGTEYFPAYRKGEFG